MIYRLRCARGHEWVSRAVRSMGRAWLVREHCPECGGAPVVEERER